MSEEGMGRDEPEAWVSGLPSNRHTYVIVSCLRLYLILYSQPTRPSCVEAWEKNKMSTRKCIGVQTKHEDVVKYISRESVAILDQVQIGVLPSLPLLMRLGFRREGHAQGFPAHGAY